MSKPTDQINSAWWENAVREFKEKPIAASHRVLAIAGALVACFTALATASYWLWQKGSSLVGPTYAVTLLVGVGNAVWLGRMVYKLLRYRPGNAERPYPEGAIFICAVNALNPFYFFLGAVVVLSFFPGMSLGKPSAPAQTYPAAKLAASLCWGLCFLSSIVASFTLIGEFGRLVRRLNGHDVFFTELARGFSKAQNAPAATESNTLQKGAVHEKVVMSDGHSTSL